MKAALHLDAYPEVELPGTLTGIGALAKASAFREQYVAEIPVRVQIDGLDPRLLPDLSGSADIELQSETGTPVVPRTAVFEEDGNSIVFLKTTEGWMKKPVKLGLESFTTVAIDAGLQQGDVGRPAASDVVSPGRGLAGTSSLISARIFRDALDRP